VSTALTLSSGAGAVGVQVLLEAPWLTGAPLETRTPAMLTVSALPSGLAVGSHAAQVLLSSTEAANAPLSLPLTLTITRAGRIAGSVLDPAGAPVAGATVSLTGMRARQTLTGATGGYAFGKLPPGRYTVAVSGTGFTFPTSVQHCTLAEGERRPVNFTAVSRLVRGRVRDAAGRPIPSAAVRLYDASGVLLRSTTTAADGSYAIRRLGPGSYKLRARLGAWVFRPAPLAVTVKDSDVVKADFTGRR